MGFAMTHEEFISKIIDINNIKVEILGKYKNSTTKILVRCTNPMCKHEWYANPRVLLRGCGCTKCQTHSKPPIKKKKSHEQFVKEVDKLHPEIEILGKYTGSHEGILVRCRIDGHEWNPLATNLLHKNIHGCPKCASKKTSERITLSHEEFMNRFMKSNNNYIEIISKYDSCDKLIACHCLICNHDFISTPYRIMNGASCTFCNVSKGEKKIMEYLDFNKISYDFQVKYDGLFGLGNGLLSYDFYLPVQNLLIEYQGLFHDGSGCDYTKENLDTQQEHDRRKREYAENHNIKLLEIWYWDFDNIETILKNELTLIS
jgi:hypothetical protein